MLSPGSTNPKLTQSGFDLVFRNIPTDEAIGEQMVQYAHEKGYEQMLIMAAKDTYGRGLANVLEREAARQNIEIVDRLSYLPNSDLSVFQPIADNWNQLTFDAIFVAGEQIVLQAGFAVQRGGALSAYVDHALSL